VHGRELPVQKVWLTSRAQGAEGKPSDAAACQVHLIYRFITPLVG
jgi:hypothetical protein